MLFTPPGKSGISNDANEATQIGSETFRKPIS